MKKLFLFILLILLSSICHAQLSAGLKLNWNINKFIIKKTNVDEEFLNYNTLNNSLMLNGGIMAKYIFQRNFSIQSELIYNFFNTGISKVKYYTDSQDETLSSGNDFNIKMQYLELPVLGRVSFGRKVKFDIFAGAYGGYLLSAKQSTSNGRLNIPQQPSIEYATHNVRKDYTSFNAGVLVGLGITMHDRVIL